MSYDWRDCKSLEAHLEMHELSTRALKVTIGTKLEKKTWIGVSYSEFGEIVYQDDDFVVGLVTDRIRPEWYDVIYIKIESGHQGYRFFQLTSNSNLEYK
jgi:hypothetical protein